MNTNQENAMVPELVTDTSALEAIERSQLDTAITTAKAYPRNIKQFRSDAMTLATLDEETASSMFYYLPRGDGIEGPSVRLAEVVGSCFGNLVYGSRIVAIGAKTLRAQGVCHDLEKNVRVSVEIERKITDRNGRRYNEDMITTTGNAACSIALRNAIFRVVPLALVKPIYDAARKLSVGDAKGIVQRRAEASGWFSKLGIDEERICVALGVRNMDDVGDDEIAKLKGMASAIRNEGMSIESIFPLPEAVPPTGLDDLNVGDRKVQPKAKAPAQDGESVLDQMAAEHAQRQQGATMPPAQAQGVASATAAPGPDSPEESPAPKPKAKARTRGKGEPPSARRVRIAKELRGQYPEAWKTQQACVNAIRVHQENEEAITDAEIADRVKVEAGVDDTPAQEPVTLDSPEGFQIPAEKWEEYEGLAKDATWAETQLETNNRLDAVQSAFPRRNESYDLWTVYARRLRVSVLGKQD